MRIKPLNLKPNGGIQLVNGRRKTWKRAQASARPDFPVKVVNSRHRLAVPNQNLRSHWLHTCDLEPAVKIVSDVPPKLDAFHLPKIEWPMYWQTKPTRHIHHGLSPAARPPDPAEPHTHRWYPKSDSIQAAAKNQGMVEYADRRYLSSATQSTLRCKWMCYIDSPSHRLQLAINYMGYTTTLSNNMELSVNGWNISNYVSPNGRFW